MFALSGFGQQFPVIVYVYQRPEYELNEIFISGKGIQMGTERGEEWLAERRKEENPFSETGSIQKADMRMTGGSMRGFD